MATTPHFGIRYASDLTGEYSEYVIDSVDLLNLQLAPHGMSFFFDTIDVRQQIIGGKHCWDMFGWVLPDEDIAEFEPVWLAGQDEKLEDYDYAFVDWEDRGGNPYAVIDVSLPEEAYI